MINVCVLLTLYIDTYFVFIHNARTKIIVLCVAPSYVRQNPDILITFPGGALSASINTSAELLCPKENIPVNKYPFGTGIVIVQFLTEFISIFISL